MIKAVLIDLDGTLVDSTPALFQVYQKFLAYYGKKGTKEEFYSLIGPSIDEIVAILKNKYKLKESNKDLATMYVSTLMKQGLEGTELFPHAKEVIEELKKKGVKLGIVTSGTHALVKICLDPLKMTQNFDAIITSEDVKNAKPNPEMYRLALEKLGVPADQAVAIEDSEAGKESARQAGLEVVMITHGKESNLEGAINCSNWDEIGTWLKSK